MLQVTIKDTKTNEVIFDDEVSTVVMQAVGREKTSRIKHTSEDAEPFEVFLCTRALIQEAEEAKKICSGTLTSVLEKIIFDNDAK